MPPCLDEIREVRLYGRHVGEIRRLGLTDLEFEYAPGYAHAPDAVPLSTSLPLDAPVPSTEAATRWFEGLLPEGKRRTQLARIVGTTDVDVWSLLDAAGAECAGAVQIVNPAYEDAPAEYPLDDQALAKLLHTTPVDPIGTVDRSARISLAGAQDKVALVRKHDGTWAVPLGGAPSTHILKPQSRRFTGLVENEHWCMTVARTAGVNAACTEIATVAGTTVLIVQRYDRAKTPGGGLARVHQEDMAQALGRTQKYERDGGPSASEIARVPGVVPAELLERLVLNWMLGNADGHAKNLSVLEPATAKARLAPAYDVLCTETYAELDLDHALTIGGAIYPGQVSAEKIARAGAELGLDMEVTHEMVAALGARIAEAAESRTLAPSGLRITIQDLVRSRAERASRMFAETPQNRTLGSKGSKTGTTRTQDALDARAPDAQTNEQRPTVEPDIPTSREKVTMQESTEPTRENRRTIPEQTRTRRAGDRWATYIPEGRNGRAIHEQTNETEARGETRKTNGTNHER